MPANQLKPDAGFDTLKDGLEKWQHEHSPVQESVNNMENSKSSFFGIRTLALLGIGGFVAYQNRFRIQRFLEANGVKTPWLKGDVTEAVKSGSAKIAGTIENELTSVTGNRDYDRAAI